MHVMHYLTMSKCTISMAILILVIYLTYFTYNPVSSTAVGITAVTTIINAITKAVDFIIDSPDYFILEVSLCFRILNGTVMEQLLWEYIKYNIKIDFENLFISL